MLLFGTAVFGTVVFGTDLFGTVPIFAKKWGLSLSLELDCPLF